MYVMNSPRAVHNVIKYGQCGAGSRPRESSAAHGIKPREAVPPNVAFSPPHTPTEFFWLTAGLRTPQTLRLIGSGSLPRSPCAGFCWRLVFDRSSSSTATGELPSQREFEFPLTQNKPPKGRNGWKQEVKVYWDRRM